MSYTTVLHIFPGDKVECGEELKNAWGSATYVWAYMGNKYIPHFSMFQQRAMIDLWKLYENRTIPLHQRAVLMMTFDRAYVSREHYARAAKDIRLFLRDHNDTTVVNHWPRIAEIFEGNPDVPAIGFWHTSVSDNPFHGGWDEEKEEYRPPNWDECYEIYTDLEAK